MGWYPFLEFSINNSYFKYIYAQNTIQRYVMGIKAFKSPLCAEEFFNVFYLGWWGVQNVLYAYTSFQTSYMNKNVLKYIIWQKTVQKSEGEISFTGLPKIKDL